MLPATPVARGFGLFQSLAMTLFEEVKVPPSILSPNAKRHKSEIAEIASPSARNDLLGDGNCFPPRFRLAMTCWVMAIASSGYALLA